MNTSNLLSIGAGPSGLSLSALAKNRTGISVSVLESKKRIDWHPGMQLSNARMQSSALKDLVTPVDPSNPFGFLSFLKSQRRLYSGLVNGLGEVSRTEFEAYLCWVAQQLPNLHFNETVQEVVATQDSLIVRSNSGDHHTKNIAVSVGKTAFVPAFAERLLGPKVIHSQDFAFNRDIYANKRVVVIGGGQSGAEIVLELLGDNANQPAHINWISRRPNLFVLEDSPFVNEWFHPGFHDWYQNMSLSRRKVLLKVQRMASDGISASTLNELYDHLYQSKVKQDKRLNLLLSSSVSAIAPDKSGQFDLRIQCADVESDLTLQTDLIVLATGYQTAAPSFLEPIRSRLNFIKSGPDEEIEVGADFGTHVEGTTHCNLFVQNGTKLQHGIANPNMALLAMRSARILNAVSGKSMFDCDEDSGMIDWNNSQITSGRTAHEMARAQPKMIEAAE